MTAVPGAVRATLTNAVAKYEQLSRARMERDHAIAAALEVLPQTEICAITGLTREQVRRIGLKTGPDR